MRRILFGVGLIGGILCFLPVFINIQSRLEQSLLGDALSKFLWRDSSLVSLTLSSLIAAELIIETSQPMYEWLQMKFGKKECKECNKNEGPKLILWGFEKLLFLLGMIVNPMIGFIVASSPTGSVQSNSGLLYLCSRMSQICMVGSALATCLYRLDDFYFPGWVVAAVVVCFVVGSVTGVFVNNTPALGTSIGQSSGAQVAILLLGAIIILCLCLRLLITRLRRLRLSRGVKPAGGHNDATSVEQGTVPVATKFDKMFGFELLMSTAFVFISALWMITLVAYIASFESVASLTEQGLFLGIAPCIGFQALVLLSSNRCTAMMKMIELQSLLESKNQFVRYISHEIRTPLNAAFLGLRLLTDELRMSTDPRDEEIHGTLCDIRISCMTAIDVLNDLLCFDKLESGILQLNKTVEAVVPFVVNCARMFEPQAKEAGVALTVITSKTLYLAQDQPVRNDSVGSLGNRLMSLQSFFGARSRHKPQVVTDADTIAIDKFKMDQVLRNLISNAIKFTPRGGQVTIRAMFVPQQTISAQAAAAEENARRAAENAESVNAGRTSRKGSMFDGLFRKASMRLPGLSGRSAGHALRRKVDQIEETGDDIEAGNGRSRVVDPSIRRRGQQISEMSNGTNMPIRAAQPDRHGKLVITVTDSGAGISPENQKRLFKEIVQFDPEKLQAGGGSGFGLFITRGIVDLHKGEIGVFSEGEGLGSTFTLEIPMVRKAASLLPPIVSTRDAQSMRVSSVRVRSGDNIGINAAAPERQQSKNSNPSLPNLQGLKLPQSQSGEYDNASVALHSKVGPILGDRSQSGMASRAGASPMSASTSGLQMLRMLSRQDFSNVASDPNKSSGSRSAVKSTTNFSLPRRRSTGSHADPEVNDAAAAAVAAAVNERDNPYSSSNRLKTPRVPKNRMINPNFTDPGRVSAIADSVIQGQTRESLHKSSKSSGAGGSGAGGSGFLHAVEESADENESQTSGMNKKNYRGNSISRFGNSKSNINSVEQQRLPENNQSSSSSSRQEKKEVAREEGGSSPIKATLAPLFLAAKAMSELSIGTAEREAMRRTMNSSGNYASGPRGQQHNQPQQQDQLNTGSVNGGIDRTSRTAQESLPIISDSNLQGKEINKTNSHTINHDEDHKHNTKDSQKDSHKDSQKSSHKDAQSREPESVSRSHGPTRASASGGRIEGNSKGTSRKSTKPGYSMLLVDDSHMNRKILGKVMKAAGHVFDEAEDGLIAVQKVKDRLASAAEGGRPYDCILMDFVMPNMDGPTATREIRKAGYKGIIFGVTGNGHQDDINKFTSNGANEVLVKPLDMDTFEQSMVRWM